MTPVQAAASLEALFAAAWANRTPVAWDNTAPLPQDEWVRLTIRMPNSRMQSWSGGTTTVDRRGFVYVQVYTPVGTGAGRGRDLAYQALSIFETRTVDGIECYAGTVNGLGTATDAAATYVTLMSCEFRFEDRRAA